MWIVKGQQQANRFRSGCASVSKRYSSTGRTSCLDEHVSVDCLNRSLVIGLPFLLVRFKLTLLGNHLTNRTCRQSVAQAGLSESEAGAVCNVPWDFNDCKRHWWTRMYDSKKDVSKRCRQLFETVEKRAKAANGAAIVVGHSGFFLAFCKGMIAEGGPLAQTDWRRQA